jgi:hypothetical protein
LYVTIASIRGRTREEFQRRLNMIPFTPMHQDYERVIEGVEQGEPEEGSPAAQGGIGADSPDLSEAGEALKKEGALDEANAEKSE